jgi:hypothetical protein
MGKPPLKSNKLKVSSLADGPNQAVAQLPPQSIPRDALGNPSGIHPILLGYLAPVSQVKRTEIGAGTVDLVSRTLSAHIFNVNRGQG